MYVLIYVYIYKYKFVYVHVSNKLVPVLNCVLYGENEMEIVCFPNLKKIQKKKIYRRILFSFKQSVKGMNSLKEVIICKYIPFPVLTTKKVLVSY